MELEEKIMVLNNVTKFHKIVIKIFELESGRHQHRRTLVRNYVRTDGQTGVTLNAPAIIMGGGGGHKCINIKLLHQKLW